MVDIPLEDIENADRFGIWNRLRRLIVLTDHQEYNTQLMGLISLRFDRSSQSHKQYIRYTLNWREFHLRTWCIPFQTLYNILLSQIMDT